MSSATTPLLRSDGSPNYGGVQDKDHHDKDGNSRLEPIPEQHAGPLSRLTFSWLTPLLKVGRKLPLQNHHLYELDAARHADSYALRFNAVWAAERKRCGWPEHGRPTDPPPVRQRGMWQALRSPPSHGPSLVRALWNMERRQIILGGLTRLISDTMSVTAPIVMLHLTTFVLWAYNDAHRTATESSQSGVEVPSTSLVYGYGLSILLFVMQMVASMANASHMMKTLEVGFVLRSAVSTAIYSKSLRLSGKARLGTTNGKLLNLMSVDATRIDSASSSIHYLWAAPLMVTASTLVLLHNLGPSALAGIAVLVLFTPLQRVAMSSLIGFRKRIMTVTDGRVKLMNEILQGIRVIKFYAWEPHFTKAIGLLRNRELWLVRRLLALRAVIVSTFAIVPICASTATILAYYYSGHTLSPTVILASIAQFNVIRQPLMNVPASIAVLTDSLVSVERVETLLLSEEIEALPIAEHELSNGLELKKATFSWEVSSDSENQFVLGPIDLAIPRGSLTMIVGEIGSGKSSLLNALVGEMKRDSGSFQFGGQVGYVPQTAWIQNATLRENILFGQAYDAERYIKTIKVCQLQRDLEILQDGDLTEIGEKGINLSGGQKQRVNLARAVYNDADVILLDDPLSAVDAHVGAALFRECIQTHLVKKTRILVTHQVHHLPQADNIILLADGKILEQGTYQDLMARPDGHVGNLMREFGAGAKKSKQNLFEDEAEVAADALTSDSAAETPKAKALMTIEERSTGAVEWRIYLGYCQAAGGWFFLPIIVLLLAIIQASNIGANQWLIMWGENRFELSQKVYVAIFVSLGFTQVLGALAVAITYAVAASFAARRMHAEAVVRVLNATIAVFDQTPIGRIMQRFARDVDTVDTSLADNFRMFLGGIANGLSILTLISLVFPVFLLCLVPLMLLYLVIASYYRSTSRELKRLDSISRSPLFAHFGETLSGLATIRGYQAQDRFIYDNRARVDQCNRVYFLAIAVQRWLGIRLEFIAALTMLCCGVFAVTNRTVVDPNYSALVITYALQLTNVFTMTLRQFAQLEMNMNSVERLIHYTSPGGLAQEASAEDPIPGRLPSDWPRNGDLEFRKATLKYRPDLPIVLDALSVKINGGERVGIVGRTGAGKSSIMIGLYRIVELVSGSILIDGVDIAPLGLTDLRTRALSIIPQDPVLFSGTVRSNMDPDNLHSDKELWDALESASIKEYIMSQPEGLDHTVSENADNFSVGQKQLLCLARARLATGKIVIMDEATASVDVATDHLIQQALRTDFKGRTLLTIAHRLNTVIDYDRILVLDAGRVVEFDTPSRLLAKDGGIFRAMVDQTGRDNAAMLREMAQRGLPVI